MEAHGVAWKGKKNKQKPVFLFIPLAEMGFLGVYNL